MHVMGGSPGAGVVGGAVTHSGVRPGKGMEALGTGLGVGGLRDPQEEAPRSIARGEQQGRRPRAEPGRAELSTSGPPGSQVVGRLGVYHEKARPNAETLHCGETV